MPQIGTRIRGVGSGKSRSKSYTPRIRPVTSWQLDQAADAGCTAVVLTVDMTGLGGNRDRINRFHREDNPACESCHGANPIARGSGAAARLVGIDPLEIKARYATLDWKTEDRMRDATSMKFLIKGIVTREDAELCVRHGVDGIIVSNHGGRAEDTGIPTIEVLPEITDAVAGRIPVLIDSGFRRGSDVFKALCSRRVGGLHRSALHLGACGFRSSRRRVRPGTSLIGAANDHAAYGHAEPERDYSLACPAAVAQL